MQVSEKIIKKKLQQLWDGTFQELVLSDRFDDRSPPHAHEKDQVCTSSIYKQLPAKPKCID